MNMKFQFKILLTFVVALCFSTGVSYAEDAVIGELKTGVDSNKQKTSDNNSRIQTLEQKDATQDQQLTQLESEVTVIDVRGKACQDGLFVKGFTTAADLICGAPSGATAAPVSLLAYYPLDGNVLDASGNGYDGSVGVGGVEQYASGHDGQAFSFNGSTFVSTLLDIDVSVEPKLTMGAWILSANLLAGSSVMSHDDQGFDRSILHYNNWWLAYDGYGAGDLQTCCWTGPINGTPGWQFVAVVYDQDAQTSMLYVDGEVTKKTGQLLGPSANMLHLGYNPGNGYEWFNGLIDEAFVVSGALSISDLDQMRSSGVRSLFP